MTAWLRVNRHRRCPICDKTDWCLIAADGSAAICPRIESNRRAGEAGYLHILKEHTNWKLQPRRISLNLETQDHTALAVNYQQIASELGKVAELAAELGVSDTSLNRFGCNSQSARS